jgi:hypothetical protein
MSFAAARSADQEQVGTLFDPAVAGADRQDVGLGDHRHGVEVEAVEGLAWQQLGLGEMACEAPAVRWTTTSGNPAGSGAKRVRSVTRPGSWPAERSAVSSMASSTSHLRS